jgi:hypothetical protein
MKTPKTPKPDPRREAAAALDAAQAAARKPAEPGGPFDLTPAEAAALARAVYGLAGFEGTAADDQAARAAQVAETIAQADQQTRDHFARALLFAASAEQCRGWHNPKGAKSLAARAAAEFSRAALGNRAAQAQAAPKPPAPRYDYGTDADSGSSNG